MTLAQSAAVGADAIIFEDGPVLPQERDTYAEGRRDSRRYVHTRVLTNIAGPRLVMVSETGANYSCASVEGLSQRRVVKMLLVSRVLVLRGLASLPCKSQGCLESRGTGNILVLKRQSWSGGKLGGPLVCQEMFATLDSGVSFWFSIGSPGREYVPPIFHWSLYRRVSNVLHAARGLWRGVVGRIIHDPLVRVAQLLVRKRPGSLSRAIRAA
jgi:hypothetical protein